ncbi:dTDP-glucose 4,6-dehydratase [Jeotgalibaca sp. MA1X17-3]|uniref:dTDP-glucose 4,6-dehydratase n=1 Tax=Jeotgalibaca sp. MA1X17-3 TaxID=2908211 RepID=UPI001F33B811|nr:dTDP-glucose 4,6-dehydratase [Jeotgalibaca sp. MA1X17-3]UJF16711.1 dTDP-glucose 4,6-dehydratase [Jeotgalibaca sp. MA1X17-3]
MMEEYPDATIINVDALTYAGKYENIADFEAHPHYHFIHADIRNREKMDEIFSLYQIDTVVNFAAESHVDRSIDDSELFFSTNVLGTQSLLDAAMTAWKININDKNDRSFRPGVKFLQVSTDEVYGTLPETGSFTEETPLQPNSPYSASKASADLLVRAYNETYGLPMNITRCSNNYGPHQDTEKLIPLMITQCMQDKKLPIYGNGLQVRDWLHVYDHCRGIHFVLKKGREGEVYNIGGKTEKTNLEIVKLIIEALDKSPDLIEFVTDRPGHDRRYAIDNTKIATELGWEPVVDFEDGLRQTLHYYLNPVLKQ